MTRKIVNILTKIRWLVWFRKVTSTLLDQGMVSGSGFIINILLARWLEPNQFGAFVLAYSIFQHSLILEPMTVLGPSDYRNHLRQYQRSLICINAGISALIILILVCVGGLFSSFSGILL